MSRFGHLSNDDSIAALRRLIDSELKTLCLIHLSQKNNHESIVREMAAALLDGTGAQLELDATAVDGRPHAHEQPRALEPVDVAGERRSRDRFCIGERPQREAGAALHEPEQRRLARRDAELLGLLAQRASNAQHDRSELVCQSQTRTSILAKH
jgi:hypothetical protein